jgi:hypothetical protein
VSRIAGAPYLAVGRAEEPLREGEDEHVEEARRDAGGGPEVGRGGERQRGPRGGDGEPVGVGQSAAVDDVAARHDGAGEPHAHRLHQLPPQLRRHRPERRGDAPRPRPPAAAAPEEGVVAGEERGGEAKATGGHFGFFFPVEMWLSGHFYSCVGFELSSARYFKSVGSDVLDAWRKAHLYVGQERVAGARENSTLCARRFHQFLFRL